MASPKKIITIDGFASSGKSTLSRELAKKLQWKWLSTGVIYRGIALVGSEQGFQDEDYLNFASSKDWQILLEDEATRFFYKNEDITPRLYTLDVDEKASLFSAREDFRKSLISFQRNFLFSLKNQEGLIAEGRDCGTKIFPEASLKIFLKAGEEARAKRRLEDRKLRSISSVLKSQSERDTRDKTRSFAPTLEPEGSFVIDTDKNSLEEMLEKALQKALETFKN